MNWSVLRMVCAGALVSVALSSTVAWAGELTNSPRVSTGSVPDRDIKKSTAAARALSRGLGSLSSKPMPLRQSNPFEARILDQQRAQLKWEQEYARWEVKAAKVEEAALKKELREKERARDKRRKEIERAQREQNRARRRQNRNVFASFGGERDEEFSASEEKDRRAESFFGTSKEGAERREKKEKPSFWQRLKRALFGS